VSHDQGVADSLFSSSYGAAYQVKIAEFEGPLDLLLHLIKKNEVDIYNIPISAITRQYLEYIELMKDLNLDIAGEFLVMAASLIQIKSRMLLPHTVDESDAEAEEDPRAELVRRLLEYQRYKDAATMLGERDLLGRDTFARKFISAELVAARPDDEPAEIELFELIEAFRRVLAAVPVETFHEVGADGISLAERITEILSQLEGVEAVRFDELFAPAASRETLIVTFMALLELCRLKLVTLGQAQNLGTIWVVPLSENNAETTGPEGEHATSPT
jgi:segregation and condensation protein A